jgi:hypothetical protein
MVTRGAVLSVIWVRWAPLYSALSVVQRVQIPGGQRGDCLGAHHHPSLLDDLEHLCDPVVHLADQPALRWNAVLAKGEFARCRHLQAHLVLDVGDEHAVSLAELTGLGVEQELGYEKQR